MWKSSVRGVILEQIQFSFSTEPSADAKRIFHEVFAVFDEIAWFHRVPVLILAAATTICCVIRYGRTLEDLDRVKRQRFIDAASKFPLWALFHKLVSSITLLHYFDNHAIPRNAGLGSLRP